MPSTMRQAPDVSIAKEVAAAAKALQPAAKRLKAALAKLDPKRLPFGMAADLLYKLRAVARQVPALAAPFDDAFGPAVKVLEEHFVNSLRVGEASGVQGMAARVQITESPQPVVKPEDWQKFWEHVAKTKQWDLLPRSVNREAVRERWDAKKQVKFVGVFVAKKVSCTTLGAKKRKAAK